MILAIVAVDNDWGIGFNGELLENIPEDLKHFKNLTTDNIVVMGKKTWESLPKKPLPNRLNFVICHTETMNYYNEAIFGNLKDTIQMIKFSQEKDSRHFFIIGGGQIYKQLLPICKQVYVTKIYKDHENIDTYFPNLDESNEWSGAPIGEIQTYKDLSYQFWLYKRI